MSGSKTRIVQMVLSIIYGDAIGNDIFALDATLREAGYETCIYAQNIDSNIAKHGIKTRIELRSQYYDDSNTVIIYHFGIRDDWVEQNFPKFKARIIFRYHNITPPEFFEEVGNTNAITMCRKGLEQVKGMRFVPEMCLAVSEFNAGDLRRYGYLCPMRTLPILVPFKDYDGAYDEELVDRYKGGGWTNIVFVGRVSSHKKHQDIIAAFAEYKKRNPKSRLFLVGSYDEKDLYYRALSEYTETLGVDDVVFTGKIAFSQILSYYKIADVFLCLSRHEGFCVPLVEAMHFGVPVVALDSTAIGETLGGAGLLLESSEPRIVADAVEKVVCDGALRESLVSKGYERLRYFDTERVRKMFLDYIQEFIKTYETKKNTIYIDIPILYNVDSGTGIQRVVKKELYYILNNKDLLEKYNISLVYSSYNGAGLINCRSGCAVELKKGDIYYSPDPSFDKQAANKKFLDEAIKKGCAVYFFVHDLIPIREPQTCDQGVVNNFFFWLKTIVNCTGIISNSQSTIDDLKQWLQENPKVERNPDLVFGYSHLGCDVSASNMEKVQGATSSGDGAEAERPVRILMVSTVEPRKMYGQAVAAFTLLREKGIDVRLDIVGRPGWNNEETINAIDGSPHLGKSLFWHKTGIPDSELLELYQKADGVLVASRAEGYGLAVAEGAAHKKPLILRDIPVFREIAGESAYYFSGFEAEDLACALEEWLGLYKSGRAPRSDGVNICTWEDHSKKIIQFITANNQSIIDQEEKAPLRIVQMLPTISYGDAVGNDTLALDAALREAGYETCIYAQNIDPNIAKRGTTASIKPHSQYGDDADIIICHVSVEWEYNPELAKLRAKKIFIYHNITPPEFFEEVGNTNAITMCRKGLEQVKGMRFVPEMCIADSEFNAGDLRRYGYLCPMRTLPILVPFKDYDGAYDEELMDRYKGGGWTNIVFVGRVAPNKRHQDIIAAFAEYKKRNPKSRLFLVGSYDEKDLYYRALAEYTDALGVEDVVFTGKIAFSQILSYYKIADVFLCLSRHEGFCVPLVEAMHFGVPVVALDSTAIGETLGGAGLLLESSEPRIVADAVEKVVCDGALRESLVSKGYERLKYFDTERVRKMFLDYIQEFITYQERSHTIWWDSTIQYKFDAGTGVQRVEKKELNYIFNATYKGVGKINDYKVVPFYFEQNGNGLFECATGNFVIPQKGDVIYSPGLSMLEIPRNIKYLDRYFSDGVSTYFSVYDLIPIKESKTCSQAILNAFLPWLKTVVNYSGIVTDSCAVIEDVKQWLQENPEVKRNPNLRFECAYPGCDISASNMERAQAATSFEKETGSKKSVRILMVSTVEPRKMYGQAVAAFTLLREKGIDVRLDIVGRPGWNNEETINAIDGSPHLGKSLFWHKTGIPDSELLELYQKADGVLVASRAEGYGLAVAEGAAHKKPLILRDIPVFREIAGESAYYFSGFEAEDLACALEEWLGLYKSGRAPRSDGVNICTWEEHSQKIMQFLMEESK